MATLPSGGPAAARPARRPSRWFAALAGVVAAAAALAVSELAAGVLGRGPSLVSAVAAVVVDGAPTPLVEASIALFGTADKAVLIAGMLLTAGALGAGLGVAALRTPWGSAAGFAAFGVLGALAAARSPQAVLPVSWGTAAVAVAVGIGVLRGLLTRAPAPDGAAPEDPPAMQPRGTRRQFLQLTGAVGVAVVVSAAGGRLLAQRSAAAVARAGVRLPPPARPLAAPPDAASLDVDGLGPLFTPNDRFYRIDTALSVPRVDPAGWRLQITGMVDRPLSISFDELLDLPQVEADITLSCVSNEVGGRLVGTARWTGVPLADLLRRAGVRLGATQVVGRSVDGWTCGFPTEVAFDGREALVAVGMNGEPLPLRHGFPARLVVPGLYGYVSATKWLSEIELTTWEAFDAYWVPRGWAKEAPIKTQSRIDVPAEGATVDAGRVPVAGVAWAGIRGIERVEVSVDGGPWQQARLADELGASAWRQWVWVWDAEPGSHSVSVRAADGDGQVQTAERSRPAPDGATGHHTVTVSVT